MSDDINVGDVVECINDERCPVTGVIDGYVKGRIYRVADVKTGEDNFGRTATGLKAIGRENDLHRTVLCFRKVPLAEESFIRDLRERLPKSVVPA
jgi:hypothetical protein